MHRQAQTLARTSVGRPFHCDQIVTLNQKDGSLLRFQRPRHISDQESGQRFPVEKASHLATVLNQKLLVSDRQAVAAQAQPAPQ
jgi:hypothetical protein